MRMLSRSIKSAVILLAAACFSLCGAPANAHDIKIATWNLDWLTLRHSGDPALPSDVHTRRASDFARLRGFADRLDADIVAFQEVDGSQAAAQVFDPSRYSIVTIDEDVIQRVGLAIRPDIKLERHPDISALDVEPQALHRLRDGLDATLIFPGGASLRILVVHLKTGCHTDPLPQSTRPQCALLAAQIPVLTDWVRARNADKVAFAILGDFNRQMDQAEAMQSALQSASPLVRVTKGQSNPCWGGGSFIDHIFLGGAARAWQVPGSLRVLTYGGSALADKDRLSDHCPVSIRLAPGGR